MNGFRKVRGLLVASLFIGTFFAALISSVGPAKDVSATEVTNPSVTYRIPCIADAFVWSDPAERNNNFGANPYGEVWRYGSDITRTYWKFNISSLPANFIIDSAVGYFYVQTVVNYNYTVSGFDNFQLRFTTPVADWLEMNITWNNQPYSGTNHVAVAVMPRMAPGNIPGMSFPDVNGTFHPDDPINYTDTDQKFYQYFPTDLTAIAKAWYSGSLMNWGVITDPQSTTTAWTEVDYLSRHAMGQMQQAPYLEVVGHAATTQVHISYYDSFTGEGIAPWTFNVSASINGSAFSRISPDITNGLFGEPLTIRVLDFFGNALYNQTRTILASDYYWDIGLAIYSYKFYDQNPTFALLRIYYNLTGVPYSEFIPPYDHVDRFLKDGTYRFMITFYSEAGVVGSTYTWVRTIPSPSFPGAGFVILKGDTISEAIIAATGTKALVQVLAQLVSPDMIWVGYTVPQIPAYLLTISSFVVNQNLFMVNGGLTDTRTGTNSSFPSPYPDATLYDTTTRDLFTFSGNHTAHIMVNRTSDGLNILNSATLPAPASLSAWNATGVTVWSNQTVSTTRDAIWRFYTHFSYHFLAQQSLYTATVTVTAASVNWSNVTLFIPFSNESYVNNRSVAIYDNNNTVALVEGTHWVQSKTGVYMWFNAWNASLTRGFVLSYNSVNEFQLNVPVHITVNKLGDGSRVVTTWNNKGYYFAIANWTNNLREEYKGIMYITLKMPVSIDESTVVVLQGNGAVVTDAIVGIDTIVIPQITVAVGDPISFTILFQSKSTASVFEYKVGGIPIIYVVLFLAIVGFILGIYLMVANEKGSRHYIAGSLAMGVATLSVLILFLMVLISAVT